MFDTELANDILTLACDKGADFAEIFAENNQKSSISLINGRVEKVSGGIDSGLGLRLFKDGRVIYIYTNDMSRDNLLKMTAEAASGCGEKSGEAVRVINADKCDTPHTDRKSVV